MIRTTTTMKGELKTDSQMTIIIPVTMDHNHDNNERRTENWVRWQQSYQSLWITTTTTMKGEPKTDSQMTTSIPVTMDHNHDNNERRTKNWLPDDNKHTSHYGSQPRQQWKENWKLIVRWQQSYQSLWITTTTTMKGELKIDSQMTTIIPVTMDHNYHNNERRTENW